MDIFEYIDLENYQIIDFLDKEKYSLSFYKYYEGINNSDYIQDIKEKEHFKQLNQYKVLKIIPSLLSNHFVLHPFQWINFLMLSLNEIENNPTAKNYHQENINFEMGLGISNLREDEYFTIPKSLFLELLTKPLKENFPKTPISILQNNLKYIEEFDNSYLEGKAESVFREHYRPPVEKSFIDYFSEYLTKTFNDCKNNFKQELLFAQRDYDYFDEVIKYVLEDYRKFQKLLNLEKGYFIPAIKEFQSYYIDLFKWLLSDFSYYLDREYKKDLEREVSPRDYIDTFNITYTNRIYKKERFKKFADALVQHDYIDEFDTERLRQLFGNNRSVDGIINWKKSIGTLYTFIKILSDKEIIKPKISTYDDKPTKDTNKRDNYHKWKIVARYIKVQNKIISTNQLRDSKFSKNTKTVEELQNIVNLL
ncbi:MAG: hypothetical protein H6604_03950 [Flavobacteriales bacterium]|nr:hypothetical protein [Flavobacteriales bacterium]